VKWHFPLRIKIIIKIANAVWNTEFEAPGDDRMTRKSNIFYSYQPTQPISQQLRVCTWKTQTFYSKKSIRTVVSALCWQNKRILVEVNAKLNYFETQVTLALGWKTHCCTLINQ
jgi:hypothetical protein